MLSPPDITDQPTNAFLYEHFLEDRWSRLRYMVQWANSLISVEVMQELRKRYPRSLAVQGMMEEVSRTKRTDFRYGYLPTVEVLDAYNDESVLQDLVEILATNPEFSYLTSREYDEGLREATGPDEDDEDLPSEDEDYFSDTSSDANDEELPCYSKETQMAVLQWNPKTWSIPDRTELKRVLKFLPPWPTAPPKPPVDDAWTPYMYFSAAAVAARFLEGLSPNISRNLRKIVLQEDRVSVSRPKTHAQAFIPMCIENPALRVERRVDVWYAEFAHQSEYFHDDTSGIILSIAMWINEVKTLYQLGMPVGCFSLVLHGPSKRASQQLCDAVVRAAIWQDGAFEIARREQRLYDWQNDDGIAEDFVDLIKEMLRGEISARFDGADMGEIWDIEKTLREHDGDWPRHVGCVVRLQDFDEPDGGWEAAREVYEENVEWMDRINGWRQLAREA
ncbi:hypothetical protein J4E85_002414 [Alternaria conjuncta]|uniref:uncharacterized protein n=1 Tax=Alternaria conjuncta TaxID=181017 RepID=UPI002220DC8E|nr:uncharacterized protein J4E85_002414 [Alternaria conjuncta]KAI4934556.1 hypothetical protein J4E85_002414 [Alternaria conjuncta]